MSRKDDADGRDFENVFSRQLISFDHRVSEFRQFYESYSIEERKQLRGWLEQVNKLEQAATCDVNIRIQARCDILDDDGEVIRWADAAFSPCTMLEAITAWDQGEDFAPSSVLP